MPYQWDKWHQHHWHIDTVYGITDLGSQDKVSFSDPSTTGGDTVLTALCVHPLSPPPFPPPLQHTALAWMGMACQGPYDASIYKAAGQTNSGAPIYIESRIKPGGSIEQLACFTRGIGGG